MSKTALCVGINSYPGATLQGCVNDADDWGKLLTGRGYDVHRMVDGDATMKNIRDELKLMVGSLRYRDRFVFQYSGHGTYATDKNGDEPDQQDEAICPVDCFSVGMFYDDEIGAILQSRAFGARILQISDSCFSGSVSRFAGVRPNPMGKIKFLPPHTMPYRPKQSTPRGLTLRSNLLMSGCTDEEYSYDAWFGSRPNGAFTRAAIDMLMHSPGSYRSWHTQIMSRLPSEAYPQTPVLEGSYYKKSWAPLS